MLQVAITLELTAPWPRHSQSTTLWGLPMVSPAQGPSTHAGTGRIGKVLWVSRREGLVGLSPKTLCSSTKQQSGHFWILMLVAPLPLVRSPQKYYRCTSGTLSRARRGVALVDRSSIRRVTEVFPTASQSHHCSLWGNLLAFWRFRFRSLPRLGRASDLQSATWTSWGEPCGTSGVLEEVLAPRVWEPGGFKCHQLNMGRRPVALQGRTGQRRADAHLSWGSRAPSWGEGGGRPF